MSIPILLIIRKKLPYIQQKAANMQSLKVLTIWVTEVNKQVESLSVPLIV